MILFYVLLAIVLIVLAYGSAGVCFWLGWTGKASELYDTFHFVTKASDIYDLWTWIGALIAMGLYTLILIGGGVLLCIIGGIDLKEKFEEWRRRREFDNTYSTNTPV